MLDSYAEQVRGLLAGGADVLLVETQQDLLVHQVRAGGGRGRRSPRRGGGCR